MFEKLEEVFDLVPSSDGSYKIEDGESKPLQSPVSGGGRVPVGLSTDVEVSDDPAVELKKDREDRELVRKTYKFILESAAELYSTAKDVADESGSPRSIEVAGGLLKNMAEIASKLEDLANSNINKKGSTSNAGAPSTTSGDVNTTNNNLFVGSSEELMRMIMGKSS